MITEDISFSLPHPDFNEVSTVIKMLPNDAEHYRGLSSGQVIASYDRRKGEALSYSKSFLSFSRLGSTELEYYLIDSYTRLKARQKFEIRSRSHGLIEIDISYASVGIIAGRELQATATLAKRGNVHSTLHALVHQQVSEVIKAIQAQAFVNFEGFAAEASRRVTIAAAAVGVELTVALERSAGQKASIPPTIEFSDIGLRVQPLGYNSFVNIQFDVVLVPDEQIASSISTELTFRNKDELRETLISLAKKYIRENITYNALSRNQDGSVKAAVVSCWDKGLKEFGKGWKTGELVITYPDQVPLEFKRESIKTVVILRNSEVQLDSTMILYIEDAQQFQNSGIPDLEKWASEMLWKVSQKVLADLSYAELASKFSDFSMVIKGQLDRQAQLIGYKVEALLIMEPIRAAELQFDFAFNSSEQVFDTINDKITLEARFSGKIASIDHPHWKRILMPGLDLAAEIKKELVRQIGRLILDAKAENFYTRLSIEIPEEIRGLAHKLLTEKFNVEDDVYINISIEQSQLKKRFEALATGSHTIEVSLLGTASTFKVKFSICGVDHWELFANRKYGSPEEEIGHIKDDLRDGIGYWINKFVKAGLLSDSRLTDVVRKSAADVAATVRASRFIQVVIESVFESGNVVKEAIRTVNVETVLSDFHAKILLRDNLKEELQKAIASDKSPEAIEVIEKKLRDVNQSLSDETDDNSGAILGLLGN